ncbi:MAG: hypothetical protein U0269_36890 [Polyangiales bacterium]
MSDQVFIVGEREHGARELVEAMVAFKHREPPTPTVRRRTSRSRAEPGMIINDWGLTPRESFTAVAEGPKREFLLIYCGDGYHVVMHQRRCKPDFAVWVLSARAQLEETLVNDVLRARYCGAKGVIVFITDADDEPAAHACERFARKALTDFGLAGDESTVVFSTGSLAAKKGDERWRDGVAQLFDALERECPFAPVIERPMFFVVSGQGESPARLTGTVHGAPLRVGAEVELVRAQRTARVVELRSVSESVPEIGPWRWCSVVLEGVDMRAVDRGETLALAGTAQLVRSVVGHACEMNDEELPQRVWVNGLATNESAQLQWLDERFVIPRRVRIVFDQPTPWHRSNYALLQDPEALSSSNDVRLWLAVFDELELVTEAP